MLTENFRPGALDRMGLGYAALAARNPRLVYGRMTGWGQTGPLANAAGHDLNYIGTTGLLALNPGAVEQPTVPPALIAASPSEIASSRPAIRSSSTRVGVPAPRLLSCVVQRAIAR